ncbi:hypothetical protein STAS_00921 [Striga asiatica]|uniref:DUF7733 domain-containing protein n=1 Tax=Striga asiatica TaxID=4170 RepID=A0A5A7NYI6_STRAF|nr:hypothetical protein STAS_00921 [Striga asiatica]
MSGASSVGVAVPPPSSSAGGGAGVMGSLRVIELQLVAFIMVLCISGLIPLLDMVFPAAASLYFLALSRFAFPGLNNNNNNSNNNNRIDKRSESMGRFFRFYVILGMSVGLFLPLAYVLGGFARGDEHAVRSAAPHLFLLSFQILTENLVTALSLFSPPLRALVPVLYTVRRIFVLLDWTKDVWINKALPANAPLDVLVWYWFGRGLSIANLVYFSVNLFCFLIPHFLPTAFERYFKERDEMHMKMAEDKPAPAPAPAVSNASLDSNKKAN